MDSGSILLIAVSLAMDCFTVCLCTGMLMQRRDLLYTVRMALSFGFFQAAMPTAAWFGGMAFRDLIASYDHWIAFALLAIIGGKMVYEALHRDTCDTRVAPMGWAPLLTLSVATSIDALAVGLSLSFLRVPIATPALTFGAVTVAISLAGVALGRRAGSLLHDRVQVVGGMILIGIGVRILLEHLAA